MALTISQTVALKEGQITPPECTLHDIIAGVAIRHANYFYNNHKDVGEDSLAQSYQQKMYGIAQRCINTDANTLRTLLNLVVTLAGNTVSWSDFEEYEQGDWETMVENNIARAFELAAGIYQTEITAYNGV